MVTQVLICSSVSLNHRFWWSRRFWFLQACSSTIGSDCHTGSDLFRESSKWMGCRLDVQDASNYQTWGTENSAWTIMPKKIFPSLIPLLRKLWETKLKLNYLQEETQLEYVQIKVNVKTLPSQTPDRNQQKWRCNIWKLLYPSTEHQI